MMKIYYYNKESEAKKMFRKTWALLLTVAMLLSCIAPLTAMAASFEAFELEYVFQGSADAKFRWVVKGENLPSDPQVIVGADITGTLEHDGGSIPFASTIDAVEDRNDGTFTVIAPQTAEVTMDDWANETDETPKHTWKLTVAPKGAAQAPATPAPEVTAPVEEVEEASNDATPTVGQVFSDIANSPYIEEINLLNAIDVLKGDPAGTFRPLDTVTRAEMAAIIVRISGLESSVQSGAETQFADVPASHWAAGYVNLAVGLGAIVGDGDGNFRPDDKVQYNEAVKMLVCVLGFELEAKERGGWPSGYMVVANDIDLTEDVINQSGEASRETVAKLTANALDIDYREQTAYGEKDKYVSISGRTLLSEKLKIQKIEGTITETYASSLAGEGDLKDNQIRIDDTLYFLSAPKADKYTGYPVVAYAELDTAIDKKIRTVIYYIIDTEDTAFLSFDPEDIKAADFTKIELFENENSRKTIEYKLEATAPVFVNGVGDRTFDMAQLNPRDNGDPSFNGKITIIDKDEDETIDALFVEITKTMVIGEVRKTNGGFYIITQDNARFPEKGKIDPDDEETRLSITKDGDEASYTDLEENDVVSYSVVGNTYILNAVAETVSGIVEKVTGDNEVIIDGEVYEYSTIIDVDEVNVGDDATLYLDMYGKIAYVKTATSGASNYAYLLDFGSESKVLADGSYLIKVYVPEEGIKEFTFAKNVDFIKGGVKNIEGGDSFLSKEFGDNDSAVLKRFGILDADGNVVNQLIKYDVNSNDQIMSMEFAVLIDGSPEDYEDEQLKMFRWTDPAEAAGMGTFVAHHGGRISSSTDNATNDELAWKGMDLMFIPADGDNILEEEITVAAADTFFTSGYASHTSADFVWYDADESGNPGLIVAKLDTNTSAEFTAARSSSYMVVTRVSSVKNEDGTKGVRVTGIGGQYRGSQGEISVDLDNNTAKKAPASLTAKPASELKAGDIIAFSAMPNGKIYTWSLMYDVDNFGVYTTLNGSNVLTDLSTFSRQICTVYSGYMAEYEVKRSGEVFQLYNADKGGLGGEDLDVSEFDTILRYDAAKGTLKEIDSTDIPIPEQVEPEDPTNLPDGVIEIDGEYWLAPKLVIRQEDRGAVWHWCTLIYVDEGNFED